MIEIIENTALPIVNDIEKETLQNAARAALKQQQADATSALSIVLTDDEQSRELNRDYRGIDTPTDVLSFGVHERDPETGYLYLGEIIISLPYAAKQAQQSGHSLQEETQLLVIHGVLHLLGHDHAEQEEKTVMWAAQTTILETLNLDHIHIQD